MSPADLRLAQQADARHEIELLSRRIRRLDHYRDAHPDASEACKRLIWQERVNLWTEREIAASALQMLLTTPSAVLHRFDPDPLPESIPTLEEMPYVAVRLRGPADFASLADYYEEAEARHANGEF